VPPKEAEYTHELSRACYHILGQNLFLTPEWRGSSSNGSISSLSNGQSNASEKEIGLINILRDSNREGYITR
jgi:hypothetical protein